MNNISKPLLFLLLAAIFIAAGFCFGKYPAVSKPEVEVKPQVAQEQPAPQAAPQPVVAAQPIVAPLEKPYLENKPFSETTAPSGFSLLVASVFDSKNALRLINAKGEVVKAWVFDPLAIFGKNVAADTSVDVRGALLLPDGSVVANVGQASLVKLDKCNKVAWTAKGAHDSVSVTARGSFWVPGRKLVEKDVKTLRAPISDNQLVEISANGRELRSISILDVIFQNNLQGLLFANGQAESTNSGPELTYINDIEELSPDMANAFPLFEEGDLLVSMQTLNLLLVVNPKTLVVKWYQTGPWNRQSDPDFQTDGTITVFDNNSDGAQGHIYGGSRIVTISPVTRMVLPLYQHEHFYSEKWGQHTITVDKNILITESERGRVFLADSKGTIIFEYTNPVDAAHTAPINAGELVADELVTKEWACESVEKPAN